jgi:malonyl-CoA O-methyltransferase
MNHSFVNITAASATQIPTVFLPGWGFDGTLLGLLKPLPPWIYPTTIIDPDTLVQDLSVLLDKEKISPVRIIGWSMGARLALDFTARFPEKVASLTLVSLRHRWPEEEIDQLSREFTEDPTVFLKTFYRKCFLGDKSAYKEFTLRIEPGYLNSLNNTVTENLRRGLNYLAQSGLQAISKIPTKLIHGRQDIIAPVTEIACLPHAAVEIVDNGGHLPFLAADCSLQTEIKHQAIQKKFSRAAHTYDRYATVQSDVACQLAAQLRSPAKIATEINSILEIGCGTGNFTKKLADRFPQASIKALDFSPEMLSQASLKLQKKDIEFLCDEAEQFLANTPRQSFDLVVSNGALQWFSDLDGALKNIARILRQKGIFLCSIFGPGSLHELASGLKSLFAYQGDVAAGAFPAADTLRRSVTAYFTEGAVTEEPVSKQYDTVHDLLLHIKKTGTGGCPPTNMVPLTPAKLMKLDQWFNENHGNCKVTYQVFYLRAMK